jgi:hypothetical protein
VPKTPVPVQQVKVWPEVQVTRVLLQDLSIHRTEEKEADWVTAEYLTAWKVVEYKNYPVQNIIIRKEVEL